MLVYAAKRPRLSFFIAIKERKAMPTINRPRVFWMTLALGLLSSPFMRAQTPKEASPAPLPAQIISAKKVFIANAGQESNPLQPRLSGGIDRTYNQFYSARKTWGRYEIVNSPADCDLVFEIRFSSSPADESRFRLRTLDPKTRIALWAFTEQVKFGGLQGYHDKDIDQALGKVVDDVKNLVTQPAINANK